MKRYRKLLSIALAVMSFSICVLPTTAFATNENIKTYEDNYTVEECEMIAYAEYEENLKTRATGLILDKNFSISKSGSSIKMNGFTECDSSVIQCGFKKIVVERRKNSNSSWSEYKVYKDLYSSSNSYTITNKTLSVTSGYQYRVSVIHYAKKSLFSTQTIEASTGYLTF